MFRAQYKPDGHLTSYAAEPAEAEADVKGLLKYKAALSEVKLTHPDLPFIGILDRVQHRGEAVEVVDFKTGKPSPKHRTQLLRYALLWWRKTGDAPERVSAQYLDGVESWSVTPNALVDVEADLAERLRLVTDALTGHPAMARPGTGCHMCAVRARCAAGWPAGEEAARENGRGDAELVVQAKAGDYGFVARSRAGAEIAVVYEASVADLLPNYVQGQRLRVVDGIWEENRTQLEIKAWTEVYVVSEGN